MSRYRAATAILYLLAIVAAEFITALVHPLGGVIFHALLFVTLLLHSARISPDPLSRLYLSLSLAPLTRVLSLSMPLAELPMVYWYGIISLPLTLAALVAIRLSAYRPSEIGLTLGKLPLQLLVATSGFALGAIEYQILRPLPLIDALAWQRIWLPVLIFLVSTGFVEELVFRGVMQRSSLQAMGPPGLIYVTAVFASLHIGYLSAVDVLFVFAVGLFFAWVVKKTGSLLGVTLSHGITNIMLYLVIPFLV